MLFIARMVFRRLMGWAASYALKHALERMQPRMPRPPDCPECGSAMVRRAERGDAEEGGIVWQCSGFPVCRGTKPYEPVEEAIRLFIAGVELARPGVERVRRAVRAYRQRAESSAGRGPHAGTREQSEAAGGAGGREAPGGSRISEARRQELRLEHDRYVAELVEEVGEPAPEQWEHAEAWWRPIAEHLSAGGDRRRADALILDSGAVANLARRDRGAAAVHLASNAGMSAAVVPSVVLAECFSGRRSADAAVGRFLRTCRIVDGPHEELAHRAGVLRARARRGSGADAVVVAMAEPGGAVLTADAEDLAALAAHARDVTVFAA